MENRGLLTGNECHDNILPNMVHGITESSDSYRNVLNIADNTLDFLVFFLTKHRFFLWLGSYKITKKIWYSHNTPVHC